MVINQVAANLLPVLGSGSYFWLLAAEDAGPQLPINRLDPVTRTKVVMALLALVLLGLGAIVCIRLGGRWVKRVVRAKPEEPKTPSAEIPSDWDRKG
jgi:hypothetical protein